MESKLFIGVAGWSYPDWKGIVYPRRIKDQLSYLCHYVDCIEINNTFYRPPEVKNSKSRLNRTRDKKDFFFTAKLHKDFTHEGRIDSKMVTQFHLGFELLLEACKLQHLLIQFKYDFDSSKEHRDYLQQLVKQFSASFNLVLEVRHKSWEKFQAQEFLRELDIIVANLGYSAGKDSFNLQSCSI